MKEKFVGYIFFIVGILDFAFAIVNFIGNKISFGVTYLILAIVFFALGVRFKKKYK